MCSSSLCPLGSSIRTPREEGNDDRRPAGRRTLGPAVPGGPGWPPVTCSLNGVTINPVDAITGTAGADELECANGVPVGHPIDMLEGDDTVTIRGRNSRQRQGW